MKLQTTLIFYFLFLVTSSSILHGQTTIYKTWVGKNEEYLKLKEKKAYFRNANDYSANYKITFEDSILTFVRGYWKDGVIKKQYAKYEFKVSKLTLDTLIINPLNRESERILGRQQVLFTSSKPYIDTNFQFEYIYLYSAISVALYRTEIEIDSTGVINYYKRIFSDTTCYKGKLDIYQMNKLKRLLRTSNMDALYLGQHYGQIDGDYFEVKCHYNNKIKSVKGTSFPTQYQPLITYLRQLPDIVPMQVVENGCEQKR